MVRPGEIYMAAFGQAGPHPVIVISREELNRGRYALVVVCTSARLAVLRETPLNQWYYCLSYVSTVPSGFRRCLENGDYYVP